jgi:hypothetical protein
MARQAARRRRRRRFTPRRWLPFLLLSGLVVVATVVESDPEPSAEGTVAVEDLAGVPTVSGADAVSTAFYCSGGSAVGDDGLAELTVVLANDADQGAVADVVLSGIDGVLATTQVEVPANGRARVATHDLADGAWVGATVTVRGGRVAVDREVSGPLGFDTAPCPTDAAERWYVGSGSTVRGATMYLSFFNPFADAASVDVALATETGRRTPRDLAGLSIPGRSVRVVEVDASVTDRQAVAARVIARAGRVIVDHLQTYDGSGDPLPGGAEGAEPTVAEGLVSVPATPTLAPRWVFPGVRFTAGARTQIALYNPGRTDAPVDVVVINQEPERTSEIEPIGVTVPAREQVVVDLSAVAGQVLPDSDVWVDVRSFDGVPIVAERLSFFGEPAPRQGASVALGSAVAGRRWLVTQAGATQLRSGGVQVANPGGRPVQVTVTALQDGDRTELPAAAITIPAGDRRSLDLSEAEAAATVVVEASGPVVVSSSLALTSRQGLAIQSAWVYPEVLDPLR